jgi:hypothetical protein
MSSNKVKMSRSKLLALDIAASYCSGFGERVFNASKAIAHVDLAIALLRLGCVVQGVVSLLQAVRYDFAATVLQVDYRIHRAIQSLINRRRRKFAKGELFLESNVQEGLTMNHMANVRFPFSELQSYDDRYGWILARFNSDIEDDWKRIDEQRQEQTRVLARRG